MNFPWQFNVGGAHIPLHIVLETAATFVGFRYYIHLRKKVSDPIDTNSRLAIFIGAIFGALIGSRLIGGLEHPELLSSSKNVLLHFYQNKTILGGLLGGLFGVELSKKIIRERRSSGDLFTYPLILAMIIGRIGCFSMGVFEDTFGTPTQLPVGMNLGDGLLRHPVALYEIVFLICLWIALNQFEQRTTLQEGARFKIFMISYLLFRFLVDFIKPRYGILFGISTIQFAAIAGLAYYARFIFQPKKLLIAYG